MKDFPRFAFDLAGFPLLVFWGLLILLPTTKLTRVLFRSQLPMLYLAVIYVGVIFFGLWEDAEAFLIITNPNLPGVQELLGSPVGASAGWIHFLCFDLLVGTYVWKRSLDRSYSFFWVSPILVFCFMLGPLGWLTFQIVDFIKVRLSDGNQSEDTPDAPTPTSA